MSSALADERWVLTGAAGGVASVLRPVVAERVGALHLIDRQPVEPVAANESAAVVDLRDQRAVEQALAGSAGVIHLGGIADEADFHDLADVNIVGSFHVAEAARRAGVRRLVFASSNRLTGFYPDDVVVDPQMPPRPDGVYGVSKVAGEALLRLYSDKFELSSVCVRIGSLEPEPVDARQLSTWLSPADCARAFVAAMTAEDIAFAAFYAVSRNRRRWWSLEEGAALGFHPEDDAERFAERLPPVEGGPPRPQGGAYAAPGFTLDRQRQS